MPIYKADVDEGDPHNDQMAAAANADLDQHVRSARKTASQGASPVGLMTIAASAFIENAEMYSRERLASIFAAALVRLANQPEEQS